MTIHWREVKLHNCFGRALSGIISQNSLLGGVGPWERKIQLKCPPYFASHPSLISGSSIITCTTWSISQSNNQFIYGEKNELVFVCLFVWLFGSHLEELRRYSWLCAQKLPQQSSGDYMECQESNHCLVGWMIARQMPYLCTISLTPKWAVFNIKKQDTNNNHNRKQYFQELKKFQYFQKSSFIENAGPHGRKEWHLQSLDTFCLQKYFSLMKEDHSEWSLRGHQWWSWSLVFFSSANEAIHDIKATHIVKENQCALDGQQTFKNHHEV